MRLKSEIDFIVRSIKARGLTWFLSAIVRRTRTYLGLPFRLMAQARRLKSDDFTTIFKHEGGVEIRLPPVSGLDILSSRGRGRIASCYTFHGRPKAEVLLRRLIFALYSQNIIDPGRSIVDIGSWLADNAIVWSRLIKGSAVVYAVDPGPANIEFGRTLAALNGATNINWFTRVCSDVPGVRLHYKGDLSHARFNETGEGRGSDLVTATLDEIVGPAQWGSIGLLHVDVEGFEFKVLRGARKIIEASRPVVLFEQHISHEDVSSIMGLLQPSGYQLYMINEVLPDCELDCRNFLAAPVGMDLSTVMTADNAEGRANDIWYAVPGDALIKLAPAGPAGEDAGPAEAREST